jgi:hypothetical protein
VDRGLFAVIGVDYGIGAELSSGATVSASEGVESRCKLELPTRKEK